MRDWPRWYDKGERINCDEIGMCTVIAQYSGWFLVRNHYGHVRVIPVPGSSADV